jgi:hypothetical protein
MVRGKELNIEISKKEAVMSPFFKYKVFVMKREDRTYIESEKGVGQHGSGYFPRRDSK